MFLGMFQAFWPILQNLKKKYFFFDSFYISNPLCLSFVCFRYQQNEKKTRNNERKQIVAHGELDDDEEIEK